MDRHQLRNAPEFPYIPKLFFPKVHQPSNFPRIFRNQVKKAMKALKCLQNPKFFVFAEYDQLDCPGIDQIQMRMAQEFLHNPNLVLPKVNLGFAYFPSSAGSSPLCLRSRVLHLFYFI